MGLHSGRDDPAEEQNPEHEDGDQSNHSSEDYHAGAVSAPADSQPSHAPVPIEYRSAGAALGEGSGGGAPACVPECRFCCQFAVNAGRCYKKTARGRAVFVSANLEATVGIEPAIGVVHNTRAMTVCAETGYGGVGFGAIDLPKRCLILTWAHPSFPPTQHNRRASPHPG